MTNREGGREYGMKGRRCERGNGMKEVRRGGERKRVRYVVKDVRKRTDWNIII